jgi:hypothetical protein
MFVTPIIVPDLMNRKRPPLLCGVTTFPIFLPTILLMNVNPLLKKIKLSIIF